MTLPTPSQSELDARARAREAGRRLAADGHPATAADAEAADTAPALAVVMPELGVDSPAAPETPQVRPEPDAAPETPQVRPADPGQPPRLDPVSAPLLARKHGAVATRDDWYEPKLEAGQWRALWTVQGVDQSADFTTVEAVEDFRLAAQGPGGLGVGVTPSLRDRPARPDSGPSSAETVARGTDTPESGEGAVRAGIERFTAYSGLAHGLPLLTAAVELAQAFGAFGAGWKRDAPDPAVGTTRTTWTPKDSDSPVVADFASEEDADTFGDMLLEERLTAGGVDTDVYLAHPGRPQFLRLGSGPVAVQLDMPKALNGAAMMVAVKSYERMERWLAAALAFAGLSLVLGAALVACAVVLRAQLVGG